MKFSRMNTTNLYSFELQKLSQQMNISNFNYLFITTFFQTVYMAIYILLNVWQNEYILYNRMYAFFYAQTDILINDFIK